MAQQNTGVTTAPKMTAAEMQQWIQDHDKALKNYAGALDPLKKLRDVTKPASKKVNSLTKERIVGYLQNPIVNESYIRQAAWYIWYRSIIFQRLVIYYSTLLNFDARELIPKYDYLNPQPDEEILRSWYETASMLSKWNIKNELLKATITCMIQDVSYNCAYYDETGLYLLPLPADYCKIYAQYPDGSFAFMADMTYFRGTNKWLVDEWGEPFKSMYSIFEREGNSARWQIMPDEYAACWKYRNSDYDVVLPPFAGLLGDLINLNDIADIQNVADSMEIYRLVYLKLQTITGAKMPDEFSISPGVALEYLQRMIDEELLPDYTSVAAVPTNDDLGVIDFSNSDHANEVNKVLKTTKAVLNSSGGAQILNSAEISGSTAFHASLHSDENFIIPFLLPQFSGWINRIIGYVVKNPCKIHFFEVGRLTRDEYSEELLKKAQYSLPTKLAVMSLNGVDPLETLALNHLEENVLKLGEKFINPLNSSYTSTGGRPTLGDDEISEAGESSRDKSDRNN